MNAVVTLPLSAEQDAALAALERAKQRELSMRWQLVPVCKLATEAKRLNAQAIITPDPDMPNGIRIELRPLEVPQWMRS